MNDAQWSHFELPEHTTTLRAEVRAFVRDELAAGSFVPMIDGWYAGHDATFSRKLGARGWLGMTWPKRYGGHERSALDRYVVVEELLAAGAPIAAHFPTERQVGPTLLRYGTETHRQRFLPAMARGELFFSIGMSEPDSGSDLASVRTRADRRGHRWIVNGTKVWTTAAHEADYIVALVRTSPSSSDRHVGLSQMIVDLRAPGVEVRPIKVLSGEHHFNEVVFIDVNVADDMVLGEIGSGWEQVTGELSFERSGPERFMATFPLLVELVRSAGPDADEHVTAAVGELIAQLWTLRRMSLAVAGTIDAGGAPAAESSMVKDVGTRYDRDAIEVIRRVSCATPDPSSAEHLDRLLGEATMLAPGFTLRGGTTEILRSVVARRLGLA